MELKNYINSKLLNYELEKNAHKKVFMRNYNKLVVQVAEELGRTKEGIKHDVLIKFIMGQFIVGRQTAQRYFDTMVGTGTFMVDDKNCLLLPKEFYEEKQEGETEPEQ